jgi:hypothetical protein
MPLSSNKFFKAEDSGRTAAEKMDWKIAVQAGAKEASVLAGMELEGKNPSEQEIKVAFEKWLVFVLATYQKMNARIDEFYELRADLESREKEKRAEAFKEQIDASDPNVERLPVEET